MSSEALQTAGYLPVATAGLTAASVLDCDLFIQLPGRSAAELYRGRSYRLCEADLAHLRSSGIDHLYIRLSDADAYRSYLCEYVLKRQDIPATARMKALREITRVTFEDALAAKGADRLVQTAKGFGEELAALICEQSPAFGEVFKTLEHDYYTFTHVCNVSLYCGLLGRRMGITDFAELADLAAAGLLHDIGKRHIPPHILNKADKLTDLEWEMVLEHPTRGFAELAQRGDLTWSQLMVVYQHHERLDGTGYPAAIKAEEIDGWARICAVVDVFDALTCKRPYRQGMRLSEASEHLEKHKGTWFDEDAVRCWTELVMAGT
jgi:HD-GYP domain-containing protein (c-di-GMP phosphodiesterase class II)